MHDLCSYIEAGTEVCQGWCSRIRWEQAVACAAEARNRDEEYYPTGSVCIDMGLHGPF